MSFSITDLFKSHSFTERAEERKVLFVPVHEVVDRPESVAVLAKAAQEVATSGKVWRWNTYDGGEKLVFRDTKQQVFLRGSLEDWAVFLGTNWVVRDTTNREYLGPSLVVTDRLVAAVLAHPEIKIADWTLQLRMKREAVR
jgi:hypothetical protein